MLGVTIDLAWDEDYGNESSETYKNVSKEYSSAVSRLIICSYYRGGGLYGRILTEVVSTNRHSEVSKHDRGQDSPIQTDLARLIRCYYMPL